MKKRTRITLRVVAGLLGLLLLATVTFYCWALVPLRHFNDPLWWESASQAERADLCHLLIDRKLEGHDVWLTLPSVGNKASIPRLLKRFNVAGATMEDGGSCVGNHCLDALRSLTEHDAGKTPNAWQSWWDNEGSKLPDESFGPRTANKRPELTVDPLRDSTEAQP